MLPWIRAWLPLTALPRWQEEQEVLEPVPCAGVALAGQSPLKQVTSQPPALRAPASARAPVQGKLLQPP